MTAYTRFVTVWPDVIYFRRLILQAYSTIIKSNTQISYGYKPVIEAVVSLFTFHH